MQVKLPSWDWKRLIKWWGFGAITLFCVIIGVLTYSLFAMIFIPIIIGFMGEFIYGRNKN